MLSLIISNIGAKSNVLVSESNADFSRSVSIAISPSERIVAERREGIGVGASVGASVGSAVGVGAGVSAASVGAMDGIGVLWFAAGTSVPAGRSSSTITSAMTITTAAIAAIPSGLIR